MQDELKERDARLDKQRREWKQQLDSDRRAWQDHMQRQYDSFNRHRCHRWPLALVATLAITTLAVAALILMGR